MEKQQAQMLMVFEQMMLDPSQEKNWNSGPVCFPVLADFVDLVEFVDFADFAGLVDLAADLAY